MMPVYGKWPVYGDRIPTAAMPTVQGNKPSLGCVAKSVFALLL